MNSSQLTSLLPDIPLIDSPLFPDLVQADAFGAYSSIAKQLNQHGLAIINLGEDRMQLIASEIKNVLSGEFDLEEWRQQNSKRGLRVQDAWAQHAVIQSLALDTEILGILKPFTGASRSPFRR